jgi:recombination protein RecR
MHALDELIQRLSRLPGMGPRSARRLALYLLKKKDDGLLPLIDALRRAHDDVCTCTRCFNLDTTNPCQICVDPRRKNGLLCIVADVADVWAMERAHAFSGAYHVLGGLLSAVDGVTPDKLTLTSLQKRLVEENIREVTFALSATLDGQTTLHYVMAGLQGQGLEFTSLAHGVPLGGELDYLDDGTLTLAYKARRAV